MRCCLVFSVLGFICILANGCVQREWQFNKGLIAEVDRLGKRTESAFLAGDIDAMLEYYCDDIISMPNGHPMVRGTADLKRQTEAILSSGLTFDLLEWTTINVQSDGDYVYEVGVFHQRVAVPGANEPLETDGKYVTIWKRQPDGTLKIAVEIYNSDASE